MINISYNNKELEDLILRGQSTDKLYKKLSRNKRFMFDLNKVMGILHSVSKISELYDLKSLHYEPLKYNPKIRKQSQWQSQSQ